MEKIKYERPVITKINAGMPDKFGMKSKHRIINKIDNVGVNDLLKEYGSPLFIISEKKIRDTYNEAYRAFSTRYPKVQFAWSYKTNYLDAVCKTFHKLGSWAEVVSGFEYEKALANNVNGGEIIFNGPSKSKEELIKAIKNGSMIHIDHFDELYTINEISNEIDEKPKVAIRVNMDCGIYPMWDRFGFNYENGEAWSAIKRIMLNNKLELVGLHTHIGTYITSVSAYQVAAGKLAELTALIDNVYQHKLKYIDLGGGFASKNTLKGAFLPGVDTCPSFDDYADVITTALINSTIDHNHMPLLILETGRALIDEAGYLAGTVVANKRLTSGRRAVILDTGINLLFTSFWYDHQICPTTENTQHAEDTTMYGPLCMNIDCVRDHILFPSMEKGDTIVIPRIGAYNMTQWLQFITYRPNIVMIDTTGKTHIIRKKEDLSVFKNQETVPLHLK